jgi:hypothetical protein
MLGSSPYLAMGFRSALAVLLAEFTGGRIALTDIGTGAAIGGVLGETAVRLAPMLGLELKIDGWREGMFLGALVTLAFWAFGEMGP